MPPRSESQKSQHAPKAPVEAKGAQPATSPANQIMTDADGDEITYDAPNVRSHREKRRFADTDQFEQSGSGDTNSTQALDHRIEWVGQQVGILTSPIWDPIEYPPPGRCPTDPPHSTIRFSISPKPAGGLKEAERCITNHFQNAISGGFPSVPSVPSFRDETTKMIQWPEVVVTVRDGRIVADVAFKTLDQAAFFAYGGLPTFVVRISDKDYRLAVGKAGRCHPRSLFSVRMTPDVAPGHQPLEVLRNSYIEAIRGLQTTFLDLQLVGAWRETRVWSDGAQQPRAVMLLVFERTPAFHPSRLPGFINDKAVFNKDPPNGAVSFHLSYGDRRAYCRICKIQVHEASACPRIQCIQCQGYGHIGANCPKARLKRKRGDRR